MNFGFPKAEHLCLQRDIESLFQAADYSLSVYPLRAVCRRVSLAPGEARIKVLISVAKRHLRHAVDRNRVKRQIREAYRLNKHLLLNRLPEGDALHLAFIWLADHPKKSSRVESALRRALLNIADHEA